MPKKDYVPLVTVGMTLNARYTKAQPKTTPDYSGVNSPLTAKTNGQTGYKKGK